MVHLGSESSFVVNFKSNHHLDRVLMDLKDLVLIKFNELFSLGGDGVLGYQNRLCVLNVDKLRTNILVEAHGSKYYVHLCATKMYHDLKEVYWCEGMKRVISTFVEESLNCQHVKV